MTTTGIYINHGYLDDDSLFYTTTPEKIENELNFIIGKGKEEVLMTSSLITKLLFLYTKLHFQMIIFLLY